jgi:SPP1 gp7 family putative phage head morphogenesis protein
MLKQEFGRVLKDMTDARLETIVRTETNRAINDVEEQLAQLDGKRWKTWVTVGDDRVREEHMAMDGLTIPINESFPIGVVYPPEGANCRCWVEYS